MKKLLAALCMFFATSSIFAQVSYKDKNLYTIDSAGCLYFDNSVTKIAKDGFRGIKEIKEVTIPEQIVSIGENAFSDCPNLFHVFFNAIDCKDCTGPVFKNDKITYIGVGDVKRIPAYIFSETTGETNLYLRYVCNQLKSIGDYAFYNTGVTLLDVSDSLTQIGKKAFTHVRVVSGENNPYVINWFKENGFDLEAGGKAKDGFYYLISKNGDYNYVDSFIASVEPIPELEPEVPAKPVNQALEDFINTDIETIGGKKIVTKTPKKYYNTSWLSQDEQTGCHIDGEGYISEFELYTDGYYVYSESPVGKLESNGTINYKNSTLKEEVKLNDNYIALFFKDRTVKYTKAKKNIKLRKKSVIGDNSVTYIACDKTTMPENGTIMFYIDGGFDEEWSSVTWNVSRKLKKDAPVEWYEPEYGYNQEPFYLHGLEEGTYQVYAGPDITKTNVITVTVTKSTDPEKRFVAPGKIWAPKNIYLVGEKCWLDVVADKPVKDVEWTILSLYKKTEQTLQYTEGTHFYFTCRNEGIYKVTAKTNYTDGTFTEDTVRIVSTAKNPQTTEGFWIRYDHLDNFYNYTYPRRSSGYMVKNSKIYKMQDQEEDSSTRTDYIVDAYPVAEFKNGKIVSLDPKYEFTWEKDRIHLEYLNGEKYVKNDFIRVPHAKIQYKQTPLPTKKTLDSKSELSVTNWDRPERTYTLGTAIGIHIHGEVLDYVAEPIDYSLFVDGKKVSDQIYEYFFQPERPGDYVLEAIAKGRESGITLTKTITYHVESNENLKKEESVSTWPTNTTNDSFPIDPVAYYVEGKKVLPVKPYEHIYPAKEICVATDEFLDDIRRQLKTGIVRVVAEGFNAFDMIKLNEVLKEAENDFAIDFGECYGYFNTYVKDNDYVVCIKNAKRINEQAFVNCRNLRKVTVSSMDTTAYATINFGAFFGVKKPSYDNFYTIILKYTGKGDLKFYVPESLETIIFDCDDEQIDASYFKKFSSVKTLEIRGERVQVPNL